MGAVPLRPARLRAVVHFPLLEPAVHVVPDNFLGLPHEDADYNGARFAVLPIPYDATTSYGVGTRDGPRAIISASQQVEFYDEYLCDEFPKQGVATLDPVPPHGAGPKEMVESVFRAAQRPVRDGKFLIGLGGEHSVTTGLVQAVKRKHKDLSVLQIDAHADLRDEYQDTPWSHACVMRRIHDLGVPAVAVGIRNYSRDEAEFIKKNDKPVFSTRFVRNERRWIDEIIGRLTKNVFVTIDIDGFDPAYAPGTGTPEPGGLDWFQVTDLLKSLAMDRTIVAADVVEVKPIPGNNVTEFLAARLIHRLIGLVTRAR